MHREIIRATPRWHGKHSRYDCVLVEHDDSQPGMKGLLIGRVRLFFSFRLAGQEQHHDCALVEWFSLFGDEPDDETGMWIVTPDVDDNGDPLRQIIHIDSIIRGVHLMPVFSEDETLPSDLHFSDSLDNFNAFFVNKFADHHSHTILF